MTPALPGLLQGVVACLAAPTPPESSGEFMAGRVGLLSMLLMLCAQEAERGVAARVRENAAMRDRLHDLHVADGDLSWTALDAANAKLRRRINFAHAEAEARGDVAADRAFLELYKKMADIRRLDVPGA